MLLLLIAAGVCAVAYGALSFWGGAMCDVPDLASSSQRKGCAIAVIGVIAIILGLVA